MKITVLGDGGWGTALSILLSEKGNDVYLWSNFPDYAETLRKKRENIKFLPGVKISEKIQIGSDLDEAVDKTGLVVLAVPSKYMRDICKKTKDKIKRPVLSVSKGLEVNSLKRMSEVIKEEIPGIDVAVLSGPTHAEEVSQGLPTAVVVASNDTMLAEHVQENFIGEKFRVYTTNDVIGVELGGSLKNVIAIGVGVCDGLKLGDNSKAALMTRGLAEIARLGVMMGAKRETFKGLSGMGDLILTCVSKYGRNHKFGIMLAEGKTVDEALASSEMVVEGVTTSSAAYELGKKCNVDMPITSEVYQVIYHRKSYKQAIQDLMRRAPKQEVEW